MKTAAEVTYVGKIRLFHTGRKEESYYILRAPNEEAVRRWVKENVFYQPHIYRIHKLIDAEDYFAAHVEEWVD